MIMSAKDGSDKTGNGDEPDNTERTRSYHMIFSLAQASRVINNCLITKETV